MIKASQLWCLRPADPIELEVRSAPEPTPRRGEVLVRVHATTVNPIDVRRAKGYGRRLLRLMGAGEFPLILGNDFSGVIAALGTGVTNLHRGDQVFGLVATGKGGAHSSHLCVDSRYIRRAVGNATAEALATLPIASPPSGKPCEAQALQRPTRRVCKSWRMAPRVGWGSLRCNCSIVGALRSPPSAALLMQPCAVNSVQPPSSIDRNNRSVPCRHLSTLDLILAIGRTRKSCSAD